MAAELLSIAEIKTFLEIPSGASPWDTLLGDLRDQAKELFERACGRSEAPFVDAQATVIERLDGTGSAACYLQYPIATLTDAILVGFDATAPDESLDPADKAVVVWSVGRRRIQRVDGGTFGELGQPLVVQVTYGAQADLPKAAKQAVLHVVAAVFRQRGSEDATSESVGGYSAELRKIIADQPLWAEAVATLRELQV